MFCFKSTNLLGILVNFTKQGKNMSNKIGSKTMKLAMMINFIGALFAYLIGSGFASGQEIMQYFSSWGSITASFIVGAFTFFIMYFTYVAYAYVGRTRGINDIAGVLNFYAGNALGRVFQFFVWAYNLACYIFMVSGFGSTLEQQYNFPIQIGAAIAVFLSVGTVLLGLTKMVEIIGKIGPVIVVFTLILGFVSAFHYYPLIFQGNDLINSGAVLVTRAGANVWLSGISFGGVCILIVSAFVGQIGSSLREYDFKYTKIIMFVVAFVYPACCILVGLNHIGNIADAAHVAIPNLLLAENFFTGTDHLFTIIILVAIYSTLCPLMWTCVSMPIKNEKSLKYKLTAIVGGISVYFICLMVPYQILLNYLMTYFGYAGGFVFLVCVIRYFMISKEDKRQGIYI